MRIGLDFDNTIVCYDRLFWQLGRERGALPEGIAPDKTAIRDHLRAIGREDVWTEMQGEAYGPRITEAEPFPGVVDFIGLALASGIDVHIVSHKTKHPYAGACHDLHGAALAFLRSKGILGDGTLDRGRVHLELTKEAKLARIGNIKCDVFVDDLPEFLELPGFPVGVRRILFDPAGNRPAGPWACASSWEEIAVETGVSMARL
jgi:hypothetical protein